LFANLEAGRSYVSHADDPALPESDREILQQFGAQTVLYVPLHTRGEIVAYAEVYESRRRRDFTSEEIVLVESIAQQTAVAIDNARLHAKTEQRLREQVALREAGAAISSALDPPTVLSRIAEQMCRAVDATSAYICSYEPTTMTGVVLAEHYGPQASERERVSDLGMTYVDEPGDEWLEIMLTGQHSVSHADDPNLDEIERVQMEEYGARSLLYIPLQIGAKLIGYAEIWESRRRREFTPEEISLCHDISRQAAVALENARLYEQAQEEIAERTQAEERIQASLEEKEVLLKEIHHRVKNNLQIISSLLNLQGQQIEDPQIVEALRDSQNRVRSMALIHEQLYGAHDLARIDFGAYIHLLAGHLLRSYRADSKIALDLKGDKLYLRIDEAIPCGLILNELVSNALKHAFPDGQAGRIQAALGVDGGQVVLAVSDDGVGLPEDFDHRTSTSLGLQLVNSLVSQLDGEITLEPGQGTGFRVTFPVSSWD
jgi:two-component sensor histidine kinase